MRQMRTIFAAGLISAGLSACGAMRASDPNAVLRAYALALDEGRSEDA